MQMVKMFIRVERINSLEQALLDILDKVKKGWN